MVEAEFSPHIREQYSNNALRNIKDTENEYLKYFEPRIGKLTFVIRLQGIE